MIDPHSLEAIERFFAGYEKGANTFDVNLIISQFTDCFMGANPNGVACFQNDDTFRSAIPQRQEMFNQLGFKSAKILSLDATSLDDQYTMVKVHWHMIFEKKDNPLEFRFYITYFLYQKETTIKVVFYISHDDEEKVMRESGLIPLQQEEIDS